MKYITECIFCITTAYLQHTIYNYFPQQLETISTLMTEVIKVEKGPVVQWTQKS